MLLIPPLSDKRAAMLDSAEWPSSACVLVSILLPWESNPRSTLTVCSIVFGAAPAAPVAIIRVFAPGWTTSTVLAMIAVAITPIRGCQGFGQLGVCALLLLGGEPTPGLFALRLKSLTLLRQNLLPNRKLLRQSSIRRGFCICKSC